MRIRRIDPKFDGTFGQTTRVNHTVAELLDTRSLSNTRSSFASVHQAALGGADHHEQAPADAVSQIGEPSPSHLSHAHQLIDEIDSRLAESVRNPLGAVATIYALLLAPKNDPIRNSQIALIQEQGDARMLPEFHRLTELVEGLQEEQRIPVASMTLPALHQLSVNQFKPFRKLVYELIHADRKWTIFEFAIHRFITRRLVDRLNTEKPGKEAPDLPVHESFQVVLSSLAYMADHIDDAQKSFSAGVACIRSLSSKCTLLPKEACSLKRLDLALTRLEKVSQGTKRQMLQAFSACIAADGKVDIGELELLRIISDALGCPMPPILDVIPSDHLTAL